MEQGKAVKLLFGTSWQTFDEYRVQRKQKERVEAHIVNLPVNYKAK